MSLSTTSRAQALVRGGFQTETGLNRQVQSILSLNQAPLQERVEYVALMMRAYVEAHNDEMPDGPVVWHRLIGDTIISVGLSD